MRHHDHAIWKYTFFRKWNLECDRRYSDDHQLGIAHLNGDRIRIGSQYIEMDDYERAMRFYPG
jgi:hypothetical protein